MLVEEEQALWAVAGALWRAFCPDRETAAIWIKNSGCCGLEVGGQAAGDP